MSCETPLREVEQAAGVTFAEYFGCLMPEQFGDVREEYRWLREGAALLDQNYRVWLDFTGPDRARYLNAVLTNNVRDLQLGRGAVSLLLNPQGHILAELETYAMADRIRVATYQLNRERTIETLERFVIMDDVTITDATDQIGAIAIEGPKTPQVLASLNAPAIDGLEDLQFVDAEIGGVKCQMLKRSPGGVASAEFVASRTDLPKLECAAQCRFRARRRSCGLRCA